MVYRLLFSTQYAEVNTAEKACATVPWGLASWEAKVWPPNPYKMGVLMKIIYTIKRLELYFYRGKVKLAENKSNLLISAVIHLLGP